ncbi:MAG: PAS domain-containing protein [Syntrophobacteraceae bacterium]
MRKKTPPQSEPPSFELLFQSLNEPMFICDSSLHILQANESFSMLFNDNGGPIIGKFCHALLGGDHSEDFAIRFNEVFRTSKVQSWDVYIPVSNGAWGKFEFTASPLRNCDGQVTRAVGHAHDISKRMSLEKELKASEERYRRIVETAREGIYIIDSEARITFANRRFSTMLGYHTDEILGRFIFDFMEEASEALARRKFERRRLGLSDTYELKLLRKGSACI